MSLFSYCVAVAKYYGIICIIKSYYALIILKYCPTYPHPGKGGELRRVFDTAKIDVPDDGAALSIDSLLLR